MSSSQPASGAAWSRAPIVCLPVKPCSSRSRSKIRFDVCRCLRCTVRSSSRIRSMISVKGASFGRFGGSRRRYPGGSDAAASSSPSPALCQTDYVMADRAYDADNSLMDTILEAGAEPVSRRGVTEGFNIITTRFCTKSKTKSSGSSENSRNSGASPPGMTSFCRTSSASLKSPLSHYGSNS